MNQLILKLHDRLNLFKSFVTGYTSSNPNKMVIKSDDKFYIVHVEEITEETSFPTGMIGIYLDVKDYQE